MNLYSNRGIVIRDSIGRRGSDAYLLFTILYPRGRLHLSYPHLHNTYVRCGFVHTLESTPSRVQSGLLPSKHTINAVKDRRSPAGVLADELALQRLRHADKGVPVAHASLPLAQGNDPTLVSTCPFPLWTT